MERSSVRTYNPARILEERHELIEVPIIDVGLRISRSGAKNFRQIHFARPTIHNAAQSEIAEDTLAQQPESLGGPALRTPTTAWAQDHVTIQAVLLEVLTDGRLSLFWDLERKLGNASARACAK